MLRLPIVTKWGDGRKREVQGVTRDLNENGVFFYAQVDLHLGTDVELWFTVRKPSTAPDSFHFTGRVVRIEPSENSAKGFAVQVSRCELLSQESESLPEIRALATRNEAWFGSDVTPQPSELLEQEEPEAQPHPASQSTADFELNLLLEREPRWRNFVSSLRQKVTELRAKMGVALETKQYQEPLEYVDDGLKVGRTDTELVGLRERILEARSIKEKLSKLLRAAETAQQAGDYEMVQRVLDEVLQLDPDDTQVKLLHASVLRLVAEHARKQQLRSLCEQLQRQVSGGQFSAAYELIKQAEAIEPNDAEVQSLKEVVAQGYEQELRRRELQAVCTEIEDALLRDDATAACAKVESALGKFLGQPELYKLKAAAEAKRQIQERKLALQQVLQSAHALIAMAKIEEALQEIEQAERRFPGEPELQSLRQDVQRQMREKLQAEYLSKSAEAAAAGDFELALHTLQAGQLVLPESTQIAAALQVASARAQEHARKRGKIELLTTKVQRLLQDHEHERAICILQRALTEFSDPGIERLLASARSGAQEFSAAVAAAVANVRRLLEEDHVDEALAFVLSQPDAYFRMLEFADVAADCRRRLDEKPQSVTSVPIASLTGSTSTVPTRAVAASLIEAESIEVAPGSRPLSAATFPESYSSSAARPVPSSPDVSVAAAAQAEPALGQEISETLGLPTARLLSQQEAAKPPESRLRSMDEAQPEASESQGPAEESQPADNGLVSKLARAYSSLPPEQHWTSTLPRCGDPISNSELEERFQKLLLEVPGASPAQGDHKPGPNAIALLEKKIQELQAQGGVLSDGAASAEAVPPAQVVAPAVQLSNTMTVEMPSRSAFRGLRRASILKLAVALVAAVVIFLGTWSVLHRRSTTGTIAYVEVDAQPWATVRTVAANDGKTITVNQVTPLRMALPRGEYTIVLTGPGGTEATGHVSVTPGQVNSYKHDFEVVDVQKIVDSY